MTDVSYTIAAEVNFSEIICPYCLSKGSFNLLFSDKREGSTHIHNSAIWKVLKCRICANNIFAIESVRGPINNIYYAIWPQRRGEIKVSESWPERPARLYVQAQESINTKSWDAALGMARASMQAIMKALGAAEGTINSQITELIKKGKLPPIMGEWAHEIRKNGNLVLHGDLDFEADEEIAKEIVNFNFYLFEYLYTLPAKIVKIRSKPEESDIVSSQGVVVSPQVGSSD